MQVAVCDVKGGANVLDASRLASAHIELSPAFAMFSVLFAQWLILEASPTLNPNSHARWSGASTAKTGVQSPTYCSVAALNGDSK